jgi:hypothetical protein
VTGGCYFPTVKIFQAGSLATRNLSFQRLEHATMQPPLALLVNNPTKRLVAHIGHSDPISSHIFADIPPAPTLWLPVEQQTYAK